jgi:hypothetical protein
MAETDRRSSACRIRVFRLSRPHFWFRPADGFQIGSDSRNFVLKFSGRSADLSPEHLSADNPAQLVSSGTAAGNELADVGG